MGTSYKPADDTVNKMIQRITREHHPHLVYVEAKIGALFFMKYDRDGRPVPGLTLHGYPACATIQVTALKHRVAGLPDALMVIDAEPWSDSLNSNERSALIDHELEHLKVHSIKGFLEIDDKTGEIWGIPSYDAHGRPNLKCCNHDWQLGGFRAIAKRHHEHALEVQAVKAIMDKTTGQYAWEFSK